MIKQITLTNFRNHTHSRIKTDNCKNVIIVGENGAGKTAILEAISLLSGDKGFRNTEIQNLANFNGDGSFSIFATTQDDNDISIYLQQNDTNRHAKINNENATLTDLAKQTHIIWLTPKEDRIFIDNASDRRSFFDRLASCLEPVHIGRIAHLNKLLSERAGAIKSHADNNWLDILDKQIATTSIAIAANRIRYAAEINYFFNTGSVSVKGMIENLLLENTAINTENMYFEYLQNHRDLICEKMVIDGVHKSDFGVFNKQLNLPTQITSTGQQKSILIDLILAHTKLIHTKTQQESIILLDEAIAHLDNNARLKLFSDLNESNAQIWATGIDIQNFYNMPQTIFITCKNGSISNIVTTEKINA